MCNYTCKIHYSYAPVFWINVRITLQIQPKIKNTEKTQTHRFVVCQQIQGHEFGTSDKIQGFIHILFNYYDIQLCIAI